MVGNIRTVRNSHAHNHDDTIMDIEDFYNWEKMSISNIVHLMVKWFGVTSVEIEVMQRDNVESGVWWRIKFENDNQTYYADGQRMDIVRRRLIERLDNLDIRKDYLNKGDQP